MRSWAPKSFQCRLQRFLLLSMVFPKLRAEDLETTRPADSIPAGCFLDVGRFYRPTLWRHMINKFAPQGQQGPGNHISDFAGVERARTNLDGFGVAFVLRGV